MRATFTAEPVEEFVHRPLPAPSGGEAWTVLADPPRTGLPTAVRRALARWGVPLVLYVSCNPATFARDLGHLLALGYSLESLAAFDLFPQTPHVEALAVLRRQ
jgi:23S rRNA (uracil1939-C5)-methyltransferase